MPTENWKSYGFYPALRTAKEDDNDNFQLSSASTFPKQVNALERFLSWSCARRSAQNVFPRQESLSRAKREKETLNVLLLHEFATSDARSNTFRQLKLTFWRLD